MMPKLLDKADREQMAAVSLFELGRCELLELLEDAQEILMDAEGADAECTTLEKAEAFRRSVAVMRFGIAQTAALVRECCNGSDYGPTNNILSEEI